MTAANANVNAITRDLSTYKEVKAAAAVMGNPKFGDDRHIAIVRAMRLFDQLAAHAGENVDCPDCDGAGETSCDECGQSKECSECSGTGGVSVEIHDYTTAGLCRSLLDQIEKEKVEGAAIEDDVLN